MDSDVASRSGTGRTRRRFRPLPIVFLLSGSALALAFGAVDLVLGVTILGATPILLGSVLIAVLIISLPTLAALVPAMRRLEGVAAELLLDAQLGGEPAPARSRSQRIRTVAWFWLHLLTGAASAAGLIFGVVLGITMIISTITGAPGHQVVGINAAVVTGDLRDLRLVAVGALLILVGVLLILICVRAVSALAPALLGPTPQERIDALDARTAQLVERARLARELHDSVGHALSVIVLQTAVAKRRAAADPETAVAAISAAEDAARTALAELDDVLGLLRDDSTAGRTPARDLTALPELIKAVRTESQQVDLVDVDLEKVTHKLPAVVSRESYRIIQEGLTNALKHAPGEPVTIAVARDDHQLMIMISNPARKPESTRQRRRRLGRGVRGISERLGILGGELTIAPASDGIWRLVATIPLPRQNGRS